MNLLPREVEIVKKKLSPNSNSAKLGLHIFASLKNGRLSNFKATAMCFQNIKRLDGAGGRTAKGSLDRIKSAQKRDCSQFLK